MNVVLEYTYRDAGNNKLSNAVLFTNRNNLDIGELEARIKRALIDGQWFVAQQVGLPVLRFETADLELDHDWHEFDGLFETSKEDSYRKVRDIAEVLDAMEMSAKRRSSALLS
jgi:hypothetical protein